MNIKVFFLFTAKNLTIDVSLFIAVALLSSLQGYFKALKRVKFIHEDVKILLRTNQQTAG